MEKKRRLFNGFDIAIALIVLLGALVWFFVINRAPEVEAPTFADNRAVYWVEVTSLTAEQVASIQIGVNLLEGAQHIPIGRIIDIEVRPHEVRVNDNQTHTISFLPIPDRYTVVLTIETQVVETDREILAEGQHAIRGGSGLNFTGPGFAFGNGIILGLDRDSAEGGE